jgi:hypothetical protein
MRIYSAVLLLIVPGLACTSASRPATLPAASSAVAAVNPLRAATTGDDLEALIAQAPSNSTLTLPAGRFVLSHSLVIHDKESLAITAPPGFVLLVNDVNSEVITIRNCNALTIEGGSFAHLKPLKAYKCDAAVLRVEDSKKFTVRHASLHGCGAIGVEAHSVERLRIEGCDLRENTFNAIYISKCSGVRIWDNVIEHNGNTLQLDGVDDLEMSGNLILDNGGYWREPAARPGPDNNKQR